MGKNLADSMESWKDLLHSGANTAAAWVMEKTANTVANSAFGFDLNGRLKEYNSLDHLMMGVGLGTLGYRTADGGAKGVLIALLAGTAFNVVWELFENGFVFRDLRGLGSLDTVLDVTAVYAGTALGILGEKTKEYFGREKIKRKERWVL